MYITIFVEGNESLFLQKLILHILPGLTEEEVRITKSIEKPGENISRINIFEAGGFTSLHLAKPNFEKTIAYGGVNLVIFDADDVSKQYGGCKARRSYLEETKTKNKLEFGMFLFPDNHHDGDYETLLESIIVEDHRSVINCFHAYQGCISAKSKGYNLPGNKEKMYSYVAVMPKGEDEEKRFKKRNKVKRDDFLFERSDIWNLESENLQALKEFLLQFLLPTTKLPK